MGQTKFSEYDEEKDKTFWTEDAQKFGKRLVAALAGVADAVRSTSLKTPPPDWTRNSEYRLEMENTIENAISEKSKQIEALQKEKLKLETDLSNAGGLRRLLYETGHELEAAILEALRLLGFDAQQYDDGKSEFDAVFVSPEGRFLGEAEGKDKQAVNIDKLSQLERNIQEDFAREDITEYAKGVLFGNPYRLTPVEERPAPFTEKCMAGAKRSGISLIFTPDLFVVAKYLKEHDDPDFARQCREALFVSTGEIVKFPNAETISTKVIEQDSQVADTSSGEEKSDL